MIIKRTIQNTIVKNLFKGKVMVIYGARRVGKTTLVKQILENYPDGKYINCDLLQYKAALETTNSELLGDFIGNTSQAIKPPNDFISAYPDAAFTVIDNKTYIDFISRE
jgi:uncharacterized protein